MQRKTKQPNKPGTILTTYEQTDKAQASAALAKHMFYHQLEPDFGQIQTVKFQISKVPDIKTTCSSTNFAANQNAFTTNSYSKQCHLMRMNRPKMLNVKQKDRIQNTIIRQRIRLTDKSNTLPIQMEICWTHRANKRLLEWRYEWTIRRT